MDTKIEKATKALLGMRLGTHKRPKKPTKADLNRRFKMKVTKAGKPSIKEVP